LATGVEVTVAADQAGVSATTAWRRLREPAFRAKVRELRQTMVAQAQGRLGATMSKAVDALLGLLASEDERVRLGTAKVILEQAVRIGDVVNLADELAELRAEVEAMRHGDGSSSLGAPATQGAGSEPPGDAGPGDAGGDPAGPGEHSGPGEDGA